MRWSCSSRRSAGMPSQTPVRTAPGQTALTRIGARSTARPRVRYSMPPAIAVESAEPLRGRCATSPLVRVIDPPSRICPRLCLIAASAPQYRTAKMSAARSGSSMVGRFSPAAPQSPAVNTRWSNAPISPKKAVTEASSRTLMAWPEARLPSSRAAVSTLAARLEPTTTSAPSAIAPSATARPMPDVPPMTTMRLPSSFMTDSSDRGRGACRPSPTPPCPSPRSRPAPPRCAGPAGVGGGGRWRGRRNTSPAGGSRRRGQPPGARPARTGRPR